MKDDATLSTASVEAVARLRAAIEDEDLLDALFDAADALVRSQIKKQQLKPPDDHREFVLELAQEAIDTLFKTADRYDPAAPVLPWLIGILKNKLLSRSRDRRRRRELPVLDMSRTASMDGQPTEADLFERLLENDEGEDVRIAARLDWEQVKAKLPDRLADVLQRRYVQSESTEDIADALGISVSYVYTLLSRARNKARKLLT